MSMRDDIKKAVRTCVRYGEKRMGRVESCIREELIDKHGPNLGTRSPQAAGRIDTQIRLAAIKAVGSIERAGRSEDPREYRSFVVSRRAARTHARRRAK